MKEVRFRGIVQTNNPTKYNDGDEANVLLDKHGRQVVTTHHVREMVKTAIADLVDGTTTVFADAEPGIFLDLIYLTAANESDASLQVTLRNDGTTVHTLEVPGNDTIEMSPTAPIPQNAAGGTWEIQLEDVTGSTAHIEALFARNT